MTVPSLAVTAESPASLLADVLVVGVRKSGDLTLAADIPELAALEGQLEAIGASGAQDELLRLPAPEGIAATSVALIGLGTAENGTETLRYAAGSAARQLRGVETIAFALPASGDDEVLAVLEGAAIGAYGYAAYRSSSLAATKAPATSITVAAEVRDAARLVAGASAVAGAVHTVRDLVNTPPSDLYPETFAIATRELSAELPVEIEVLDERQLAEGGYGGILGVGQGSTRGPRLVKVSYSPAGASRHLALVGKGITFDSGGLSLKPPASMVGMKYDMTGAATVLGVTLAAARLALPLRVTAWLCLAENLPSGSATRPNDVLRIRGGKTVEVLNTDAEGRLVLADGLVAASEERPDAIVDVATLTGAARVALGDRYVAAMGDEELVAKLSAAADDTGELLWPMPLPAYLRGLLASDIADIANVKPGNTAAGMLIAGVFLKEFVGDTGQGEDARRIPWAHLDIAGPADNGGAGYGYTGKGPTGVAVRSLIALATEISRA